MFVFKIKKLHPITDRVKLSKFTEAGLSNIPVNRY